VKVEDVIKLLILMSSKLFMRAVSLDRERGLQFNALALGNCPLTDAAPLEWRRRLITEMSQVQCEL